MEEIRSIRREQIRAATGQKQAARAEKPEAGAPVKQAAPRAAASLDLKQLMGRISRAEAGVQAARQALRSGEAVLAEVRDSLDRMEDLAGEAAKADGPDREALQEELSQLKQEFMRILGGQGAGAGLLSAGSSKSVQLPDWLLWGMADAPDPATLLRALGIDESAGADEIMSALSKLPIDDPAAGYLAAVYLGSVIAGGGTDSLDAAKAAQGLLRLLEAIQGGMTPDEAISDLTGGLFEGLEDFQQQFLEGLAPGMDSLLSDLLLGSGAAMPDLISLLSNGGGEEVDLLLTLLAALESADSQPGGTETADAAETSHTPQPAAEAQNTSATTAPAADHTPAEAANDSAPPNTVPAGREAHIPTDQSSHSLNLKDQAEIELPQAGTSHVTVEAPQAQLRTRGEASLPELRFGERASLTLTSSGLTHIGVIKGGTENTLRLREGAFVLEDQAGGLPVRVVIDGAVMLNAPKESRVFSAQGESLDPVDLMWKSLFPDMNSVGSMVIDGRRASVMLERSAQPDLMRLWLFRGDPSQGYPAHLVALEGRNRAGELATRYVYLQWSRMQQRFRQTAMFPNPFTVTGGEEDVDWRYEEESRTLRVLSGRVTALTGGTGTDAQDRPFSGRLALMDGIGPVELTLEGVVCRVPSGRACSLGRGNSVTLLLAPGTSSLFESGAGCAGISLGDGTSLCIDRTGDHSQPDGSLTAKGGAASPGIGRDSGPGRERAASVIIRGGKVTAVDGERISGGRDTPNSTLAGLGVSVRALKLDAMDISTREAARDAVRQLSAGRRWVSRLQEAYRAVYGRLEQKLSGLGSVRQYAKVVRDGDEVGAMMWDMRQELLQSPMGAYSQWELDDVDQLLGAMERMINK